MSVYLALVLSAAFLYGSLGLSLNLQVGHTGIINFGHVAFFALGAYTSAMLSLRGFPLPASIVAGSLVAGLAALPIGWVTTRLTSHYLAIVTIGFAEALRVLLENLEWTGGPTGLIGVPRPFGDTDVTTYGAIWLVVTGSILAVTYVLVGRVSRGPFGLTLRGIHADEKAASMLGRNVAAYKTIVLVWGSALAGLAGAFYAHWIGYVSAEQFDPKLTFYLWAGIIIGGASRLGAVVGSVTIVAIFEASRFLRDFGLTFFSDADLSSIRWIVIGVLLIVMLRFRPDGLLPLKAEFAPPEPADGGGQPERETVRRGSLRHGA